MELNILLNKDPLVVANLNRVVQEKHVRLFPKSFKKYHHKSILKAVKLFLDKENTYCFIVYFKDEPIGYATLLEKNYQENPYRNSYIALVIDQMCIHKEYQNRGVGTLLIDKIKVFAKKNKYRRIELSVWSKNEEAKSLYEKVGFQTFIEYMGMEI